MHDAFRPRPTVLWGTHILNPTLVRPPFFPQAVLLAEKVIQILLLASANPTYIPRAVSLVFNPRAEEVPEQIYIGGDSNEILT